MLVLFKTTEDIRTKINQFNCVYEHEFKASTDPDNTPIENVYISTYNNVKSHVKYAVETLNKPNAFQQISHEILDQIPDFPKDLHFKENLDEALGELKNKNGIKIAVMNGMSNAMGDHLIGMKALKILQKRLTKYFNIENIQIDLFQLNPVGLGPINAQSICPKTYILPVSLATLSQYDAFYDLGGLLLLEGFNEKPMIDFFLDALSVGKDTVPVEQKRIEYTPTDKSNDIARMLMKQIRKRAGDREILMFHTKASSEIRSIDKTNFERLTKEIIDESEYFVVTCVATDLKLERFMALYKFSSAFDIFAAIVSMMDKIITVDTCTYHLADAFDVPTLTLFTSIPPERRNCYYPYVKGMMLVDEKSVLYNHHKYEESSNKELIQKIEAEIESIWSNLSARQILDELDK